MAILHFIMVRISEDTVCRLCGEEVESAEHLWLRCPALLVERHHSDLVHMMDELDRLPRAALALVKASSDASGNINNNSGTTPSCVTTTHCRNSHHTPEILTLHDTPETLALLRHSHS